MMLARVFADAAALWRRDRDFWLRLAGFCFFLPAFAIALFVPPFEMTMPVDKSDTNAIIQQWMNMFYANAGWAIPLTVWQIYSAATMLVLVLDPARPSLAAAAQRALRSLPGLVLVYLGAALLVGFGLSAFIVPGLYMIGRTLLSQPILIAEPKLGPLGALISAIQRSRRRGWMLFFVIAGPALAQFVALGVVGSFAAALGEATNAPVHFVFGALQAAVVAASTLAQTLLMAAAYREVTGARQGI